jgi:hypothetical protein
VEVPVEPGPVVGVGGSVVRVDEVPPEEPDVVPDVTWPKAGKSKMVAVAAKIPRARH